MTRFRSLAFAYRWLALAVVLLALAVRIVVPAGMMPGHDAFGATVTLCTGHGAVSVPGPQPDPAKPDAPCAFSGLTAAALDSVAVPPLPALPLPVGIALVAVPLAFAVRTTRLRPPLRGPPALPAV